MIHISKAIRPLFTTLLAACSLTAFAQRVSVKTNALYWAAATPNLGAEFRLNRHLTLNLETAFNRFDISKVNTRMAGVMPEMRYWFSARPQAGHFIGLMALVSDYKLTYDQTTHEGNGYGVGPTYGYSFVLSKRWSMEATAGVGLLRVKERKYAATTNAPANANNKRWLAAPLKVGLTFVYIIK